MVTFGTKTYTPLVLTILSLVFFCPFLIPSTRLLLLNESGNVMLELGLTKLALLTWKAALATNCQDRLEISECADHLAGFSKKHGKFVEATKYALLAVTSAEKILPTRSYKLIKYLDHAAQCSSSSGDYSQAIIFYRKELAIKATYPGDDKVAANSTLNNLAGAYFDSGQFTLAETSYQSVVNTNRKYMAKNDLRLIASINNLGEFYAQQDSVKQSKQLFDEALKFCDGHESDSVSQRITVLFNYGYLCLKNGENAKSKCMFAEALSLQLKTFPNDPLTQRLYAALIQASLRSNKYEEMLNYLQQLLRLISLRAGPESMEYAFALGRYGKILVITSHYSDGKILLQQAKYIGEKHGKNYLVFLQGLNDMLAVCTPGNTMPKIKFEKGILLLCEKP